MNPATERAKVVASIAKDTDAIKRFGITKEELIEAIAQAALEETCREAGNNLLDRVTIPLAQACNFSGLSRDQLARRAPIVDHGKRNQRITLAAYDTLIASKTKYPAS